jgi:hypothetical protein
MRAVRKLGRVQASGDAVELPGRDVFAPLDDSIDREVDVVDVPGRDRHLPGDAPRNRFAVNGGRGFDVEASTGACGKRNDEQNGDKEEMERKALRAADE